VRADKSALTKACAHLSESGHQNPRLTAILNARSGNTFPTTGRNDIVTVLRTVA